MGQKIYEYVRVATLVIMLAAAGVVIVPCMMFLYLCALVSFPFACIYFMFIHNDLDDFLAELKDVYLPFPGIVEMINKFFRRKKDQC